MARTIAEIKQGMTDRFMAEEAVRERYGFTASDTFESKFSKVSIEGLLLYVVAFGIWVVERLMDEHRTAVEGMLAERLPHTARWYRNLVLGWVPEWAEEAPVKWCSVDDRHSRLRIKVAAGEAGARRTVDAAAVAGLEAYLAEEKDAGLRIEIVNENRNRLKMEVTVWYDAGVLLPSEGAVERVLREAVSNMEFDGLLSRNGLEDAVQGIAGVRLVRTDMLETRYDGGSWKEFGVQRRAESGYWVMGEEDLTVHYELWRRGVTI